MKQTIKTLALATAVVLGGWGIAPAPAATVTVSSAIEKSQYWVNSNEYVLDGIIVVRSNATLTVQAGTVIRGQTDAATTGSNNPGTLIVARGSKLKLLGTEAQPVIFTDMVDDNYPGGAHTAAGYQTYTKRAAQWGGVAICGRAYLARGTAAGPADTSIQLEGIAALGSDGLYGGTNDDDDSGTIRYVSIRYAGFGLAANNELNGLGLAGIGRETAIDHVEIMNNLDDGIEIWGGTVNAKYLACWNVGDDSFDIDEGYRGKLQFLFAAQGRGSATSTTVGGGVSDRGMELDGGNSPDNSAPFGLWKGFNITLVGKGQTGGASVNYPHRDANVALYMRDNAAPQIHNGVFVDFGGWGAHVENEGGDGKTNVQTRFQTAFNGTGFLGAPYHVTQTSGFQAQITGSVFYQFGMGLAATSVAALTTNAASDASAIAQAVDSINVFTLGGQTDNVTAPASLPIVALTRTAPGSEAATEVLNLTSIDPRAANDAVSSPVTAPTDGFYTPVAYRGAFSSANNWLKSWTAIDFLGLLPATANPAAPTISVAFNASQNAEISVPTVNGVTYCLESSEDNKHWSPLTLINGTGGTIVYEDVSALVDSSFYRVVVP